MAASANNPARRFASAGASKEKPRAMRAGFSKLTAMGFQRLAVSHASNLRLKIQNATAPRRRNMLVHAALLCDWALKSPAFMSLRSAQKVQDDLRENLWT
ncbi:hypothetical protein GGD63_000522 [Bradyrhizobium sp. cir1]|uniref:hypothetical protein n=1 Tax=Bradyrhizobium sp. cir1 TaxID=1445730 RepID=UPI0016058B48|nr:hypothetical protein [Bradyrhizobium sp. cir1]MBB4367753.1 hypothetical protein [Bradyrhizobium sp. cir1]